MESASWTTTGTELTRVIGELTRGREIADQLLSMLRDDVDAASVLRTGTMVEKILDSFTGSLSMVMGTYDQYSDEASQVSTYIIPPTIIKTEDSGESCKKPAPKDRRGCYKRRRTSETWTKETATSYEDGHAWRKYGQKVILHAEHPRNYYRCTHKYDQLCQATKYVQKIQDQPSVYRTTYHGHHSCKKLSESPHYNQLLMDGPKDSSVIWSFQSDNSSKPATMKQDHMYQTKSSHSHDDSNNYLISANYNDQVTPRLETSSSVHNNNRLSTFSSAGSDQGDEGYSCTTSTVDDNNNTMDLGSLMNFEEFPEFY